MMKENEDVFKIISSQRSSFLWNERDTRKCTAKEEILWGLKKEEIHRERKTFQKEEYGYMKIIRSIQRTLSLVQLKSGSNRKRKKCELYTKWQVSKRNVGKKEVRCTKRSPIQKIGDNEDWEKRMKSTDLLRDITDGPFWWLSQKVKIKGD